MGVSDKEACKMSYMEFYTKVIYLSHVSEYQRNLSDILKRKK